MKFKALPVIALSTLAITACDDSNDNWNCDELIAYEANIIAMQVTPFEYQPENDPYPYESPYFTFELSPLEDAAETNAENYLLSLTADIENTPLVSSTTHSWFDALNGLFISKAYACTPAEDIYYEEIDAIRITSDQDFSEQYPAGSELNELFIVQWAYKDGYSYDADTDVATPYTLAEYVAQTPDAYQLLQIRLSEAPTTDPVHQFTIEYSLTNGEQYVMTTPLVTFVAE
ncbi:hypothetical protein EZV61_04450 [Corallincola luteus]|uniref:Uncharacterized protein n=1 Tax=Corallincola luteus TaxID=1775177 RepID=A0ABY2APU4_9GAMM|nr:hypothetical protein [Corallincola luteus]TCI05219.1 hypothetical protein EZV61_04450 [Corallincola luteus]